MKKWREGRRGEREGEREVKEGHENRRGLLGNRKRISKKKRGQVWIMGSIKSKYLIFIYKNVIRNLLFGLVV
jgi:hypothetical protein